MPHTVCSSSASIDSRCVATKKSSSMIRMAGREGSGRGAEPSPQAPAGPPVSPFPAYHRSEAAVIMTHPKPCPTLIKSDQGEQGTGPAAFRGGRVNAGSSGLVPPLEAGRDLGHEAGHLVLHLAMRLEADIEVENDLGE